MSQRTTYHDLGDFFWAKQDCRRTTESIAENTNRDR